MSQPNPKLPPGLPVPPGTPVRVYRNLHARCWSVQIKAPTGKGRAHAWKVAGHAQAVVVTGATFKVYEKGRQRVLKTGVKNVHAFVLGVFQGADYALPLMVPEEVVQTEIAYNPRRQPHFHDVEQPAYPIARADKAYLTSLGLVFAEGASE